MTYRKIKKAFVKRFGVIMMIKLYRKKDRKYIIKASKKVTAYHMRRILIEKKAKGSLSYFAKDKLSANFAMRLSNIYYDQQQNHRTSTQPGQHR